MTKANANANANGSANGKAKGKRTGTETMRGKGDEEGTEDSGGRGTSRANGRGLEFTGGSGGFRHWSPCYSFIQKVEKLPAKDLDASNAVLRERVVSIDDCRTLLCGRL